MKHLLVLSAAILAIAIPAAATPACTTLEGNDINSASFSGGCTLGGLTFSNFSYSSAPTGTSVFLSAVGTGVVGNDVDLGFQLTTATPPVDIILFYSVSTGGPATIIGVDNQQNGLNTTIQEVVCSVAFVNGVCPTNPTNDVLANFKNPPNTSATFAAQSTIYIQKDISLPFGNSFISSFVNSQDLTSVPEPTTLFSFAAGLGGLLLLGKRRAQQSK